MSMLRFVNDRFLPEKRNFETTIITFTDNTGVGKSRFAEEIANENGETSNRKKNKVPNYSGE
ncbi:4811_t:CDS:2 [Entrophospora sp. SA101]|nr:4811_t:CDS:2 [Entrophospora sp. SA101]